MISVITGDIVNSKKANPKEWLKVLKKELNKYGETPRNWEIYRGDSFQIEIKNLPSTLTAAIQIKAAMKTIKGVDVRLAIGLGNKLYNGKSVTEANGTAFIYSGDLIEELKRRKLNLAIRTENQKFDKEMNLYLKLGLTFMDEWTVTAAKTIVAVTLYPEKSQEALGKLLGIKQNAISTRLKRARFEEIKELIEMFKIKIKELP